MSTVGRKIWLYGLAALLTVLVLFILARPQTLRAIAQFLDVGEPPRRADYAMILGGGVETRPFAAASLLHHGWVNHILISELPLLEGPNEAILPAEHDLTRKILLMLGVPEESIILLPGNHASTFDEIVSLRDFLRDHPRATVLVVTDALHTRRTAWSVRRVLGPDAKRARFVSAVGDSFDPQRWWLYPDGFFFVISEYLKLAFYCVRYADRTTLVAGGFLLAVVAALPLAFVIARSRRRGMAEGTARHA